jgi:hypothetical protein
MSFIEVARGSRNRLDGTVIPPHTILVLYDALNLSEFRVNCFVMYSSCTLPDLGFPYIAIPYNDLYITGLAIH